MLIERAAGGGGGVVYTPGAGAGAETVPGPESVDVPLAQFLLALRTRELGRRTGNVGRPPARATEKELNEAILAKLDLLDQRLRAERGKGRSKRR